MRACVRACLHASMCFSAQLCDMFMFMRARMQWWQIYARVHYMCVQRRGIARHAHACGWLDFVHAMLQQPRAA